ncbi:MAG: DUF4242 domain-containing protein [Bacteriovoracaceae bacterium]|nr:DUF4242 domain-containing protein [Bacteriovoracaceae bacterium]
MLKKYIVERNIADIGLSSSGELRELAEKSNKAIEQLGSGIEWHESFISNDKIYSVYIAEDENILREHGRISGLPVDQISQVDTIIDPTTATLGETKTVPKDTEIYDSIL